MLFQAGVWLAIAYFGVVRFLSYIDRRIRLEGWEIELRFKAVGRAHGGETRMMPPLVLVATLVLLGPQPTGGDMSTPRGLMRSGLSVTPDLGVMKGRSPGGGAFRSVSFSSDAGPLTPDPSPRWGEGERTTRGLGLQNPVIGSNGRTASTAHFAKRGKLGAEASSPMLHPAASLPGQEPAVLADRPASAASLAREALREGSYPWYDSEADRVRPVWPQQLSWLKWLGKRAGANWRRHRSLLPPVPSRPLGRGRWGRGRIIGDLAAGCGLVAFFVFLIVLAYHLGPAAAHRSKERARLGTSARLADLPEGMRDRRRRPLGRGHAQARPPAISPGRSSACSRTSCSASNALGLIRLVPGLTGRQYVRGLRDPELVECVRPTLALFEWVYYGRRTPTARAFDDVWRRALVFDARTRGPGASP